MLDEIFATTYILWAKLTKSYYMGTKSSAIPCLKNPNIPLMLTAKYNDEKLLKIKNLTALIWAVSWNETSLTIKG
jgi:hypothetical protein